MITGKLNNTTKNQFRARNWRLRAIGFEFYKDYLNSDEWFKVKTFAFNKDKFKKCFVCGDGKNIIIHHRTYSKIRSKSMKKQMTALVALCGECHHKVHKDNLSSKVRGLNASVRYIKRTRI